MFLVLVVLAGLLAKVSAQTISPCINGTTAVQPFIYSKIMFAYLTGTFLASYLATRSKFADIYLDIVVATTDSTCITTHTQISPT